MPDVGGGEGNPFVMAIAFSDIARTIGWKRPITSGAGSFGGCNKLSAVVNGRVAVGCTVEGNVALPKVQGGTLSLSNIGGVYVSVLLTGNGDAEWHTWLQGTNNVVQTLLAASGTVYAAVDGTSVTESRSNTKTTTPLSGSGRVLLALTSTTQLWGKGIGASSSFGGQGTDFGLSPNGDIVAAGAFRGTLSFGSGMDLTADGDANDLYIARIAAADGTVTERKQYGSTAIELLYGLGIAPVSGDLVLATGLQKDVKFDSVKVPGPANPADGVLSLLKFSPTTQAVWANTSPASTWVSASNMTASVSVAGDGSVILSGAVPGILSLPGGNAVNGTVPFDARGFIAAFAP
jgi:hypothetical protein